MRGRKEVTIPDEGVDLILKIRGDEYAIRPSAADMLRFQGVASSLGDLSDPAQEAALVDALLTHLTRPHTEFILSLSAQMQGAILNELWDWFVAAVPKEEGADPTFGLSESPKAPESASPMSSDGPLPSSSELNSASNGSGPSVTHDASPVSAPPKEMKQLS